MDLSSVIASLGSGTYTVTRGTAGSYGTSGANEGVYVPGSTSTFSIRAAVQPVSGRDLLRLPEGLRTSELIAIWTATALQTASPQGAPADRIAYNGTNYEVQQVEYWAENGGYYKVIAKKDGPQ